MIYLFDRFELDTQALELRRGGDTLDLEPLVFELLLHLVRNAHRVVTKDELLSEVWQDRAVVDSVVTRAVSLVRRAVGTDAIRTRYGRGYRFVRPLATRGMPGARALSGSEAS